MPNIQKYAMTKRTKNMSAGNNPLFSSTLLLTNVVPQIRTTNKATKCGMVEED